MYDPARNDFACSPSKHGALSIDMAGLARFLGVLTAVVAIVGPPLDVRAQVAPARSGRTSAPDAPEPPFVGVSLKVGDEIVPPGGLAQVKLFVTEPQPISTASARLRFPGFSTFAGVALMSPAGDTMGVAVVQGSELMVSIISPSATFGVNPDYPILTIAGRVPANAALGATFPLDVDEASLRFTDAAGALYPIHANGGTLQVAANVGVDDVFPGSADVAAGDVVTILGRGFKPQTRVKFEEILLSRVEFVDASQMRATLAEPARMHGMGIKIDNRDGAETEYFSYQRTSRQGTSRHPVLSRAVPLFSDGATTIAVVGVEGASTGLAIQNLQAAPAQIAAELLDAKGIVRARAPLTVESNRFVVAELTELFGVSYSPGQQVRVQSLVPVQVMGIAIDAAGSARPIAR
jgi:hypothetical protein